jgi:hypothetical protein
LAFGIALGVLASGLVLAIAVLALRTGKPDATAASAE